MSVLSWLDLFGHHFRDLMIYRPCVNAANRAEVQIFCCPVKTASVSVIAHRPLNIPPTHNLSNNTCSVIIVKKAYNCAICHVKVIVTILFVIIIDRFYFYQKMFRAFISAINCKKWCAIFGWLNSSSALSWRLNTTVNFWRSDLATHRGRRRSGVDSVGNRLIDRWETTIVEYRWKKNQKLRQKRMRRIYWFRGTKSSVWSG